MDIDNPRTRQHMQAGRRVVHVHMRGEGVPEKEEWTSRVCWEDQVAGQRGRLALARASTPKSEPDQLLCIVCRATLMLSSAPLSLAISACPTRQQTP